MQQSNLSERNAFCRFFIGTGMTAFGIAKASRNPDCTSGKLMIALGAMKMAEGIFKYCPTKAMLNSNMQSMLSGQNSMTSDDVNKLMKDFSAAFSSSTTNTKSATSQINDTAERKQNTSDNKNSTNKAQNPS